jgi:biotin operon repressor
VRDESEAAISKAAEYEVDQRGWSQSDIARELDVSRQAIQKMMAV